MLLCLCHLYTVVSQNAIFTKANSSCMHVSLAEYFGTKGEFCTSGISLEEAVWQAENFSQFVHTSLMFAPGGDPAIKVCGTCENGRMVYVYSFVHYTLLCKQYMTKYYFKDTILVYIDSAITCSNKAEFYDQDTKKVYVTLNETSFDESVVHIIFVAIFMLLEILLCQTLACGCCNKYGKTQNVFSLPSANENQ